MACVLAACKTNLFFSKLPDANNFISNHSPSTSADSLALSWELKHNTTLHTLSKTGSETRTSALSLAIKYSKNLKELLYSTQLNNENI